MDRPDRREDRSRTPAPSAALRIQLLGQFEVLRDGVPIPPQAWRRRRPSDLLKLVALSPDRRLSRDRVIDTLWPDKDPASGANNLHRALYDLRVVLGGRYVDIEGAYVVLSAGAWVDVDAFEGAVARGDDGGRQLAVALYRGDLSPDDLESPWLQTRRRLLRSRFAEVAIPVAHESAQRGDAAAAVIILRRLLVADPGAEEAHRLLMELLARSGSRAEALGQYEEAVRAMRAAGQGLASSALRALRDAIERRELGPALTPVPLDPCRRASLRLLGDAELQPIRGRSAQLQSVSTLVQQGTGVLVILGEAGVGKTRFALELARLAQERGTLVLAGAACVEHPSLPFAPFEELFREEARENPAAPANPFAAEDGGAPLSCWATRTRLFAAVASAIAATARDRPLLLVLDDLHAADDSSLDLLHYLAVRAQPLRLGIVATCWEGAVRSGTPIQTLLTHLDADRLARGIRLPRLTMAASAERLADLLGEPPPSDAAARICEVTDGNPFQLEQVARAWSEGGRGVVPSVPSALRERLARIDPAAGPLLAAAAVIGERFPLELTRDVAGLTAEAARAGLDAAARAHLLSDAGTAGRFTHGLVRDEVLASLDPVRRAELHRSAAVALEAEAERPGHDAASPDRLAWHWKEAFEPARALRHLVAAGHRAALRTGLREACGFHESALALGEQQAPGGAQRFELLDAIGRGRLGLGELEAAAEAFRRAAAGGAADGWRPAPEQRARERRSAATALAVGGDDAAAHRELDLGLSDATGSTGDEVATLLLLRAQLHWHAGSFDRAQAAADWCAAEADRLGQPDLLARAGDLVALSHAARGEPSSPPGARSGPADRRSADPLSDPLLDLPIALWETALVGDLPVAEVLRLAELALARGTQRGDREAAATAQLATGAGRLAAGDVDGAERALGEALRLFRATGSELGEAATLERIGAVLNVRGRLYEAMEALADGVVVAERAPLRRHLHVRLHVSQARNRLAAGSLHAAEVTAREAAEVYAGHGACSACEIVLRPLTARIAIARDRIEDADVESSLLEALAAARGGRTLQATSQLVRVRVLGASGRKEEALALLAQARATFEALGRRYDVARCARAASRLGLPRDPSLEALLPPDASLID